MLLTNPLDFNIGVYYPRLVLEYPLKTTIYFVRYTKQRRYKQGFITISKGVLYKVE